MHYIVFMFDNTQCDEAWVQRHAWGIEANMPCKPTQIIHDDKSGQLVLHVDAQKADWERFRDSQIGSEFAFSAWANGCVSIKVFNLVEMHRPVSSSYGPNLLLEQTKGA